jgi:hypothetical protein
LTGRARRYGEASCYTLPKFSSGLVAKSSKFYQEHPANQTAHDRIVVLYSRRASGTLEPLWTLSGSFPFSPPYAEDL